MQSTYNLVGLVLTNESDCIVKAGLPSMRLEVRSPVSLAAKWHAIHHLQIGQRWDIERTRGDIGDGAVLNIDVLKRG